MPKVLRYYQEECLYAIFDFFSKKSTGSPVCAIPCGLGKSLIIAEFIRRALFQWPTQRMMMLAHITELVGQNGEELRELWPEAPVGFHAAELNDRDTASPIIYGTIQSVCSTMKKAASQDQFLPPQLRTFGWRDVLLIDEAHLLSDEQETQYQYVIARLREINPRMVVIGFSATPFRTKQGLLTNGKLFTDVCYDITGVDRYNRLVAEGFISPLIPKPTQVTINMEGVKMRGGDFVEKEAEARANEVVYQAVQEAVYLGMDRKYWMAFAAGIENCENITSMLQSFGVDCVSVHSKIKPKENTRRIKAFKNGEYRAIIGANKLAIGFNYRPIDFLIDLQPTSSPGKNVQKYGRGSRISPETQKVNCLCLDFAGNIPRCGPINDPVIPNPKNKKKKGSAPIKICPNCGMYNSAAARYCGGGSSKEIALSYGGCGHQFSFETSLYTSAGTAEIVRGSSEPVVERFAVRTTFYALHEKKGSAPSIKVTYVCGLKSFNEWVCLEHKGIVAQKAKDWWKLRHAEEAPLTTYEALQKQKELRSPKFVTVRLDNQYPEILSVEF